DSDGVRLALTTALHDIGAYLQPLLGGRGRVDFDVEDVAPGQVEFEQWLEIVRLDDGNDGRIPARKPVLGDLLGARGVAPLGPTGQGGFAQFRAGAGVPVQQTDVKHRFPPSVGFGVRIVYTIKFKRNVQGLAAKTSRLPHLPPALQVSVCREAAGPTAHR